MRESILDTERYIRIKNKVESVFNNMVKVQPFSRVHFNFYLGKDSNGLLSLNGKKFESPVECILWIYHGELN